MNKTNLLIDLGIFTAFLAAEEPHLTGNTIHEWLSLALAATVVVHIVFHWKWIAGVGFQFFKKLFHVSRLKFVVDVLLFIAFTAVIMSGVMISRSFLGTLGIQMAHNSSWKMVHNLSANLALLMVGLHFALNWKWVVSMLNRYTVLPIRRLLTPKTSANEPTSL